MHRTVIGHNVEFGMVVVDGMRLIVRDVGNDPLRFSHRRNLVDPFIISMGHECRIGELGSLTKPKLERLNEPMEVQARRSTRRELWNERKLVQNRQQDRSIVGACVVNTFFPNQLPCNADRTTTL